MCGHSGLLGKIFKPQNLIKSLYLPAIFLKFFLPFIAIGKFVSETFYYFFALPKINNDKSVFEFIGHHAIA